MMRPFLRFLGSVSLFLLATGPVQGAPPSASPPGSSNESPIAGTKRIEEYQSLGLDRRLTPFTGTVLDLNDHPLSGVQVKVFNEGQELVSGITDGNGVYDLRAPYDPASDATVLLWFAAPDHSLMTKEIVIHESRRSVENGIISRCIPRAPLTPGRQFRVYLFDPASRTKELSELDCLP
ncbi:MAG TPA: carboxypeptidase-like regulatory domain-containing protein [Candidatus Eisenbacteria bacterium]|nr:carboxypeptidase-like regulatory domain-containing protein [Candidatus Eisenbacteria bacterium]